MRRVARSLQLCLSPLLALLLVGLTADSGQSQPPGGDGGRRGGFGGGTPDPDTIWGYMAQGRDTIDLNQNARMKSSMERNGDPIPANGILTKDQFKANFARRAAQGGGMGGGRGGTGGGPPVVTAAVPGQPGAPAFGGGGAGGAPGGAEWVEGRFRESDKNKDGFITLDEASDRMKPGFAQADKNGDGKLDLAEYKGYMAERMGGGPIGPGGGTTPPPQFAPSQTQPDYNAQFGAGSGRGPRREEEETPRVSVSRFGKLPKEAPAFFTEYDDDRDGMVGLYEWRRHGRKSAEFVEMDLNADGYLTADEWLRYNRIAIEKRDQESLADKSPAERGATTNRVSTPDRGGADKSPGDKGGKGDRGGKDRGGKDKPANPFTTGK